MHNEVLISLTVLKLGHLLKLTIFILRLWEPHGLIVFDHQVIILDSRASMLGQESVTRKFDVNLVVTIINGDKFILRGLFDFVFFSLLI